MLRTHHGTLLMAVLLALFTVDAQAQPPDKANSSTAINQSAELPAHLAWQNAPPPFSHRGNVLGVAYSPDGKWLATISQNQSKGGAYLWEAATGTLLRQLLPANSDSGPSSVVALSPDGKLVAAGSVRGAVIVWEAATGRAVSSHVIANRRVSGLAFLNNDHIVAGGEHGQVTLLKIANQEPARKWTVAPARDRPAGSVSTGNIGMTALAASRDGTLVAAGSSQGTITIWKQDADKAVLQIDDPHGRRLGPVSLSFTPDGARLVSTAGPLVKRETTPLKFGPTNVQRFEIKVWDSSNGNLAAESVPGNVFGGGRSALSPDGKLLASASFGGIHVWRLGEEGPRLHIPLPGEWGLLADLAFSPDSTHIAASNGHSVSIWNTAGQLVLGAAAPISHVNAVAWNPDGIRIAIGDGQGVHVWSTETRSRQSTYSLGELLGPFSSAAPPWTVAFSPDGKAVYAAGNRDDAQAYKAGVVREWDVAHTAQLKREIVVGSEARDFVLSRDGRRAVIASSNGSYDDTVLFLHDSQNGTRLRSYPADGTGRPGLEQIKDVWFSPDGRQVRMVDLNGVVSRWDTETGERQIQYVADTREDRSGPKGWVAEAVFTNDGRTLVTSSRSVLAIWDNEAGKLRQQIVEQEPCHLAVSQDGRLLAGSERDTGGRRDTSDAIHIWDLTTGQEIRSLKPQDARATSMSFSPDSKQLLTGYDRGTFAIWDVQ